MDALPDGVPVPVNDMPPHGMPPLRTHTVPIPGVPDGVPDSELESFRLPPGLGLTSGIIDIQSRQRSYYWAIEVDGRQNQVDADIENRLTKAYEKCRRRGPTNAKMATKTTFDLAKMKIAIQGQWFAFEVRATNKVEGTFIEVKDQIYVQFHYIEEGDEEPVIEISCPSRQNIKFVRKTNMEDYVPSSGLPSTWATRVTMPTRPTMPALDPNQTPQSRRGRGGKGKQRPVVLMGDLDQAAAGGGSAAVGDQEQIYEAVQRGLLRARAANAANAHAPNNNAPNAPNAPGHTRLPPAQREVIRDHQGREIISLLSDTDNSEDDSDDDNVPPPMSPLPMPMPPPSQTASNDNGRQPIDLSDDLSDDLSSDGMSVDSASTTPSSASDGTYLTTTSSNDAEHDGSPNGTAQNDNSDNEYIHIPLDNINADSDDDSWADHPDIADILPPKRRKTG